ncbi:uncharacterized protein LOC134267136 [Saccostrea cucullata]|uniref:uncharacterized protein LOC134267136 n=1 Tax=Saccostrea cuccullata TaxID=36930 RepID=UPI002ED58C68
MRSLVDLEEKVWTSGYYVDTPSLFILPMVKEGAKPTKLETFPLDRVIFDMCFNFEGDLVFSDCAEGSVNIWKDDQVKEVVRLQDWTPMGVHATKEDILVCMIHTSTCDKKIVRHRQGSTEHFEYDQDGEPLFSDVDETLYIAVNQDSDLCVSDYGANKGLVLNKSGLLQFTYTGETFLDAEPFGHVAL